MIFIPLFEDHPVISGLIYIFSTFSLFWLKTTSNKLSKSYYRFSVSQLVPELQALKNDILANFLENHVFFSGKHKKLFQDADFGLNELYLMNLIQLWGREIQLLLREPPYPPPIRNKLTKGPSGVGLNRTILFLLCNIR